jgi:hypothetical protein
MPALTVTKEELLSCGISESDFEHVATKADIENNAVQIVDIVSCIEALTLFNLIELKRGKAVLRQFFADCAQLDPHYIRTYARQPADYHKMMKQIKDPQGRHGGAIESLAMVNIRRYQFEEQMIGMPNITKEHSDDIVRALAKLSELLTVVFVVPA